MMSRTLQLSDGFGRLGYREVGSGHPVVLIHGVGMQSAAWRPQMAYLAPSHRVIALDMPGHGDSTPLPRDAELPNFVAWLRAAADMLGLRRFSLAGHSMGALIAGGFSVSHPELVARVALVNGVFRRDARARAAVETRARLIREGSFDHETPLARWFGNTTAERAARDQVAEWLGMVDIDGYGTAYSAFARGDATYADRFGEIRCPLLALTGSDDCNSSPAMSRAMARAAPRGRAVIVEGHRHMVNLTAPDRVNEALREWLETVETKEETA